MSWFPMDTMHGDYPGWLVLLWADSSWQAVTWKSCRSEASRYHNHMSSLAVEPESIWASTLNQLMKDSIYLGCEDLEMVRVNNMSILMSPFQFNEPSDSIWYVLWSISQRVYNINWPVNAINSVDNSGHWKCTYVFFLSLSNAFPALATITSIHCFLQMRSQLVL